jgi:sigma-B regulation protein RsbU (phosphoserine phosphatase)
LRVAGCSIPAKEVGGDFFAYHSFADGRLGVAVGDVSGKGVPAALLMALALNTFETLVDTYPDQGALLTACNGTLAARMIQSKQNAAFLSVVLDSTHREARVANAGLVAPLLWRGGAVEYIESFGLPLGATHAASYTQQTVELRKGDRLLLVSDGIVEAMNGAHELWGFERLEAAFRSANTENPAELIDCILAHIRAFTGDAPQHDDMTMVAIEVK